MRHTGRPVSASLTIINPLAVGRPCDALAGTRVIHLQPNSPGAATGMALANALSPKVTAGLGGTWAAPWARIRSACPASSTARSGVGSAVLTSALLR